MKNYNQLCVLPGTIVGPEEIKDFEAFFLDDLGVRVKYECETKTLPDIQSDGNKVEEGTYFYRIKAIIEGGEELIKHGFVVLKY